MAYQLDPFQHLLEQRPPPPSSAPVSRDMLETRKDRLDAFGLEGTGLDRLNDRAIGRLDARDAARTALKESAKQTLLGSGAASAL